MSYICTLPDQCLPRCLSLKLETNTVMPGTNCDPAADEKGQGYRTCPYFWRHIPPKE